MLSVDVSEYIGLRWWSSGGRGSGASAGYVDAMVDVAIVGAGVAGLTAAFRLRQAGLAVEIFEARERVGGRAYTAHAHGRAVDLGATWVWDSEAAVHGLLRELDVSTFTSPVGGLDTYDDGSIQRGHLPQSQVPERRLVGGMAALVDALGSCAGVVRTGARVEGLVPVDGGIDVRVDDAVHRARVVLAALPPSLVVPLCPQLPSSMARVPVWMGQVAKCVGLFDRPVWRDQGFSGRAFSRVGPMSEVHDLSDASGPALFGFAHRGDSADLDERVSAQFSRLFGEPPGHLMIQRWWQEPCTTAGRGEGSMPLGHPMLQQSFLHGRLFLISCETSGVSPGHIDGAIERAESVCREIVGR